MAALLTSPFAPRVSAVRHGSLSLPAVWILKVLSCTMLQLEFVEVSALLSTCHITGNMTNRALQRLFVSLSLPYDFMIDNMACYIKFGLCDDRCWVWWCVFCLLLSCEQTANIPSSCIEGSWHVPFKKPIVHGLFPLQTENGSLVPVQVFIFGMLLLHRFLTQHKGSCLTKVQQSAQCRMPPSILSPA